MPDTQNDIFFERVYLTFEGRCVEADLGYLGCAMDVLHLADKRCSGRRECAIRIPDAELDATKPCFKELKTYLEASYTCVPGNCQHLFVTKKVCATVFSSSSDKYLGTLFLFVYLSELFRKFMPVARVYFSVIFITLYRHGDLFRGEDLGNCTE